MSTILLAEVDDNVTILVSTLLAARGHTVETRSDGKEAIELIRSQPFDLLIIGDQLSDIDG
ncbi:MAG: hybrid sensor histidine kinase/response regulator, partial [Cyanobacteria bacterium PR.023]|nr:hybrid sensor histidine kinase/response regulator [Cyanobacteria bacterium PR.023]